MMHNLGICEEGRDTLPLGSAILTPTTLTVTFEIVKKSKHVFYQNTVLTSHDAESSMPDTRDV